MRWLLVFLCAVVSGAALAGSPTRPINTFDTAKTRARNEVYYDRMITFYCQCTYIPWGKSGGRIDPSDCGFVSDKKGAKRAKRIEWAHIVPASVLAAARSCGQAGHEKCDRPGRECCETQGVDPAARFMINDLHNLVPVVGSVYHDRSNHPYGDVAGEPRNYGVCDFEVGGSPKKAEPRPAIQGNIARIWLYMADTYNVPLTTKRRKMFEAWSKADPPGEWEQIRDKRIELIQGNRNPFVPKLVDEDEWK
jgi:deoxyribonuclease-1